MCSLEDSELQTFENYLLAENKQEFLKNLIPGTDLYYFFNLLDGFHASNGQLSDENKKNLESYEKLRTPRSASLKLRGLFTKLVATKDEKERKKLIDKIATPILQSRGTNYTQPSNFSGSNLELESKQQYQSQLNENLLKINLDEVYINLSAFGNLKPEFLSRLDTKKLKTSRIEIIERFLKTADVATLEGIPELILVVYDHYMAKKGELGDYQTMSRGIHLPQQQVSQMSLIPNTRGDRSISQNIHAFPQHSYGSERIEEETLRPPTQQTQVRLGSPFGNDDLLDYDGFSNLRQPLPDDNRFNNLRQSNDDFLDIPIGHRSQNFDYQTELAVPQQQQQDLLQPADSFLNVSRPQITSTIGMYQPNAYQGPSLQHPQYPDPLDQSRKWSEFIQDSSIYSRLNLKQLEELKTLISAVVDSPIFVKALLTREFRLDPSQSIQNV